jgi:hypothetical protein
VVDDGLRIFKNEMENRDDVGEKERIEPENEVLFLESFIDQKRMDVFKVENI